MREGLRNSVEITSEKHSEGMMTQFPTLEITIWFQDLPNNTIIAFSCHKFHSNRVSAVISLATLELAGLNLTSTGLWPTGEFILLKKLNADKGKKRSPLQK